MTFTSGSHISSADGQTPRSGGTGTRPFQIFRKVCLQNLAAINDLLMNANEEYSRFAFNGADASKSSWKRHDEEIAWEKLQKYEDLYKKIFLCCQEYIDLPKN